MLFVYYTIRYLWVFRFLVLACGVFRGEGTARLQQLLCLIGKGALSQRSFPALCFHRVIFPFTEGNFSIIFPSMQNRREESEDSGDCRLSCGFYFEQKVHCPSTHCCVLSLCCWRRFQSLLLVIRLLTCSHR